MPLASLALLIALAAPPAWTRVPNAKFERISIEGINESFFVLETAAGGLVFRDGRWWHKPKGTEFLKERLLLRAQAEPALDGDVEVFTRIRDGRTELCVVTPLGGIGRSGSFQKARATFVLSMAKRAQDWRVGEAGGSSCDLKLQPLAAP